MIRSLLGRFSTMRALGLANVARVLGYRIMLRTGIHPVQRLAIDAPSPPFFHRRTLPSAPAEHGFDDSKLCWFGWHAEPQSGDPPEWHYSPFSRQRPSPEAVNSPWWQIPDFDHGVGDIKTIWEPSRLDWAVGFAQLARAHGEPWVDRLNAWLADWCVRNPPYFGHNWKCGQEASIRVLHLALVAELLQQRERPEASLLDLIACHLQRIAPTMSYAIGQANNHGTSEAAALFVGGTWLDLCDHPEGARWARRGRGWLEDRALRLIMPDGSFSQYSVNYHRFVLDTYSVAELWRRWLNLPLFKADVYGRLGSAVEWLRFMTEPGTGDAPNLGANDGANLLPLSSAVYRDYRPAVELASALFCGESAFPDSVSAAGQLAWLGVRPPTRTPPPLRSRAFDDGGYAILVHGKNRVVMRYPRYRYRPSHADPLHVDLWIGEFNVLRDGGTYSYSAPDGLLSYFSGIRSHNTIQFDEREPMPRYGRFLWGDWLQTSRTSGIIEDSECTRFSATYVDSFGAEHTRSLELTADRLLIRDDVRNFSKAVLRWRLDGADWRLEGRRVANGSFALDFEMNSCPIRVSLVEGLESRYYMEQRTVTVLEVETAEPGLITTRVLWPG